MDDEDDRPPFIPDDELTDLDEAKAPLRYLRA
jgi:hypothetical protein